MRSKAFFLLLFASVVCARRSVSQSSSSSSSSHTHIQTSVNGGGGSVNINNQITQTNVQNSNGESTENYIRNDINTIKGSISVTVGDNGGTFGDGNSGEGSFKCKEAQYSLMNGGQAVLKDEYEEVPCKYNIRCLRFLGFIARGGVEEFGLFSGCAGNECGDGVASVTIVKDGDARQGEAECCTGRQNCKEMAKRVKKEMDDIVDKEFEKKLVETKAELAEEMKKGGKEKKRKKKRKNANLPSHITAILTVVLTILL